VQFQTKYPSKNESFPHFLPPIPKFGCLSS
jgi:hypothetical protein